MNDLSDPFAAAMTDRERMKIFHTRQRAGKNKLCLACLRSCKQSELVEIISCPMFKRAEKPRGEKK